MNSNLRVCFAPSNNVLAKSFYEWTAMIIFAVIEENPDYKQMVGNTIYRFVECLYGPEHMPKLTGCLIDLDVREIRKYLVNFDLFVIRIS